MTQNQLLVQRLTRVMPLLLMLLLSFVTTPATAGVLETGSEEPYGKFSGVDYVRYTGRFIGATSQGEFRVPFEIVAPANPARASGTIVIEPPHFLLGVPGRDATLGNEFLFERRMSHASVGFAVTGGNLLDPGATDLIIAGQPAIPDAFPFARDVEILAQFSEALIDDPFAREMLGHIRSRYAYGVSQSAEAIFELQYGRGAEGLFDLTLMHVPLWRPPFADPRTLATLPDEFRPLTAVGKVLIVSTEGDLIASEAIELRNAVQGASAAPNYRLYEVAGAPHLPQPVPLNPLDSGSIVRAAFIAGDRWVRFDRNPPASRLLDAAPEGEIDIIHGRVTGIARDFDGNALGGIALPDVETGRALFVASIPVTIPPGLVGLIGSWFDLACAPRPGSGSLEPRFANHGEYVRGVARQSVGLLRAGYLLPDDALAIVIDAADSDVGKPGSCGTT